MYQIFTINIQNMCNICGVYRVYRQWQYHYCKAVDPDLLRCIWMRNCSGSWPTFNSHTWTKKSHGHCINHASVNNIDLPDKLCDTIGEGQRLSPTYLCKAAIIQSPIGVLAAPWRSTALPVSGETSTTPVQMEPPCHCTI